jgi:hypothetical protein
MKLLLLALNFFLLTPSTTKCDEALELVRVKFHQKLNENDLNTFLLEIERNNCTNMEPYRASAIMQKAQFTFFPTEKLRYFLKGKRLLEDFIVENPNHLEARYVRIIVQRYTPSLLMYNDDIDTDRAFIKKNIVLEKSLSVEFKKTILHNINF